MYLIVLAWLYVALLIALSARSVLGGVLSFVFAGLLPIALLLWILAAGSRHRRSQKPLKPDANDSKKPL